MKRRGRWAAIGLTALLTGTLSCTAPTPLPEARPRVIIARNQYTPGTPQHAAAQFLLQEAEHRVAQLFPSEIREDQQHRFRPTEIPDTSRLTTRDLEQNITHAFNALQRFPWTQELDDNTFNRFVLPYRNGTNLYEQFPGIHWRTAFSTEHGWNTLRQNYGIQTTWQELTTTLDTFAQRYRTGNKQEVMEELIRYVNTTLWAEKEGIAYKRSNAQEKTLENILKNKGGRCTDLTHLAVMSLRAFGVPATVARVPAWGTYDDNHAVVAVRHNNRWITFDAIRPPSEGTSYWYTFNGTPAPKIYIEEFGNWPFASTRDTRREQPWHTGLYLGTRSCADRTGEFIPTTTITVNGLTPGSTTHIGVANNFCSNGIAYVMPTTVRQDGTATFQDMGRNILYFTARDAILACNDGTTETLAGGTTRETDLSDQVPPGKTYELCRWSNGTFTRVRTITVRNAREELATNTAYTLRDVASETMSRPFILRPDGTRETH
ncbi:transglutaminase domain-containing protein [Candidatus Woesearchaeota archaeon]|nr:transglutaminase domain-containing protein [Candidatus Woesearchaeota archaeon]